MEDTLKNVPIDDDIPLLITVFTGVLLEVVPAFPNSPLLPFPHVKPEQVKISETEYLTNVIKISAGVNHVLALTQTGEVYAYIFVFFMFSIDCCISFC